MTTTKSTAQQVREVLDNTYYKTSFSVQISGSAIKIIWTDGPTEIQLTETLNKEGITAKLKTTRNYSSLFINGAIQTWRDIHPEQADTVITCAQNNGDAWHEFDNLDTNAPNLDYLETIIKSATLNGTELVFSR